MQKPRFMPFAAVLLVAGFAVACEDAREPTVTGPQLTLTTPADAKSFTELDGLAPSSLPTSPDNAGIALKPATTTALSSTGLTLFTDRNAFNAFCPTLPLETFENNNVGGVCSGGSSLNSATNDACYSPGAVLPGFTLSPSFGQYVSITPPFFGVPSVVVGPNFFAANTNTTFAPAVTGAGFDLVDVFGGSTWKIEAFSASGSEGSTTSGAGFVGLFSPTPLTRIEVTPVSGTAAELFDDLSFGPCIIFVDIDIKPGSDPNSINLGSKGVIPVAILTTAVGDGDASDFDAADVDPSAVTLGNDDGIDTPVKAKKNGSLFASLEDVDGDGDLDLSLKFDQPALEANGDLDASSTELILNGATFGGQPIQGSDAVRITPASS